MDDVNRLIIIYSVRILCFMLFFTSTFSFVVTWKSFITGAVFLGSFIYPSFKETVKAKKQDTPKTRDLIKELYPTMPHEKLEEEASAAICKLVTYNARDTPALHNFGCLKENSDCLFAKTARVWSSPEWDKNLSIGENVYRFLPMFLKFTIVCASQKLDAFLVELPGDVYGTGIKAFGDALREVLTAISDHDPEGYICMNKSFIGKRGWVFEFNKCTFFITTFAPFYPESHPRYAHGAENCYILFQPELSFAFHDLTPDTPETNWENPLSMRDKIRVAFKDAGRPYSIPDSIYSPMALEILRPIDDTEPVYEWWMKRSKVTHD